MDIVMPEQVGISSERLRRIHPAMQRYVDEGKVAGIMSLVARRGQVAYIDCVGMMDMEAGRPLQEDAIFRIYSLTKPVTSVALLMLYEEGRLRLNDPIMEYIPSFGDLKVWAGSTSGVPELAELQRAVTVRDLLTHTAGLSYGTDINVPVDVMYREANIWADDPPLEEFVARIVKLPLVSQPGATFRYSVALDVVGRLIEVISGLPLDRFFQNRIFEPLGMLDTGFTIPPHKISRLPTLYNWNDSERRLEVREIPAESDYARQMRLFNAGGGLVSTMSDYLRFSQMLINGGELDGVRLLSHKTVDLMTMNHLAPGMTVSVFGTELPGYGYGLGTGVLVDLAQYGELGSSGSYSWAGLANAFFWNDPHEQLTGILMSQFMPLWRFPLETDFRVLTYQALLD